MIKSFKEWKRFKTFKKILPLDAPESFGNHMVVVIHYDANQHHNAITSQSVT